MGRELSTLISLDVTSTIIYKTKHKPDRPFYKIWASTETTQCRWEQSPLHYDDVTMSAMASQITSLTIVSIVYSGPDQRRHQSSASLAFVRGIHRWPVNSPHKWPVTRKMFPFDDVIMGINWTHQMIESTAGTFHCLWYYMLKLIFTFW